VPEADGFELDYPMPDGGMSTYCAPVIPEAEEIAGRDEAIALLRQMHALLCRYRVDQPAVVLPLDGLDEHNLALIDQVLGNGEVSAMYHGAVKVQIQESVLAGLWRVQHLGADGEVQRDTVEIAAIPGLIRARTFKGAATRVQLAAAEIPAEVYNAPPLLAEIDEHLPKCQAGSRPHVINLSLLPHNNEDLEFLSAKLGIGPAVILSRGYGNCRISSTATRHVWWVQYFNSQETLILNTLEISVVPEVACAAQEDIDDSAQRLQEILAVCGG